MQRSSVAPDMQVLVFGKQFFFLLFLFVWKGKNHAFGQGTQTKYCYFTFFFPVSGWLLFDMDW